ncbi:MAG TPA: EAL domain-containing protein [Thiobacillus sp.]|nr:MAG: hypothetical protein B7Y50_13925 [Hydrogenophilales bacterium 28-61-11]OYZ56914.1 MAG: hypothetical protein B7Y21_09730 [Hydrogenophilales bacterium 16-61-112]HQT71947.1 EAL domain-containing protein [Thiobacillus sp.]
MKPDEHRLPRVARALWLNLAALVVITVAFAAYVLAEKQIDRANESRLQSFLLADELRQSSNDQTRMVRTYVATSDPQYKQQYEDVLAIRNGKLPRPPHYQNVYWDLILPGQLRPRVTGSAVSLLQRMRQAGFTAEEFALLEQAKAHSDALSWTEYAAMSLIETATPVTDAVRNRATLMLQDTAYHQAKRAIMQPINTFYSRVETRTQTAVEQRARIAMLLRVLFVALCIVLLFTLWRAHRTLNATLGGSANQLFERIARLGRGDFSSAIPVTPGMENSVMGWLSETQIKLSRIEAERENLAHFDVLTGLPNRAQLGEHLQFAIHVAKRHSGHLALMFIDIDHFKDINDTLGHRVGDILLIELSRRLRQALREEDIVSRQGGDEFIVMLPDLDERSASLVAQKLLAAIGGSYGIEHHDLSVTASIGIALYPADGEDLESLSKNADTAMYHAKQEGRNGYRFFTAEMQARSARHLQLGNALRHALERNELSIHYQPQLALGDGRIVGAEALLRWRHPELGLVSPAEFIPVAEDNGLILLIGEWVLRQAVEQAKTWLASDLPPLVMAVNLSAVQFRHPALPDLVTRILDEAGLPPEYLELELTEGVAMHNPQGAIAVMNNLHDRGVRMSIDDFGTGYSSLGYLKKFNVYKLKIDQSFVRDIRTDPEDKAIVSAIIQMAKSLGLATIAEGVETAGQLAFLREQGCDEVQGYYYSKPLTADAFARYVKNPDVPHG